MKPDLRALKANHPLPPFFERDGFKLLRSSNHFLCLCPFHLEKTPSCHVWEDHFHCFGCHARGDIFDYLQKSRSLSFPEALRQLGAFITPKPPSYIRPVKEETPPDKPRDFFTDTLRWRECTTDAQMADLAAKLGVSSEALWWIGAAWAAEHRAWAFPMRDGAGHIIGIRLRNDRGKKWAVTGSRNGLFIAPEIPRDDRLYICEGPTDTAAALSLGFWAIGRASCSSGVADVEIFVKKQRVREMVLISDNDSPGLAGARTLRDKIPVKSWLLLLPLKDIRRYCQVGGGRQMIETMIRAQCPKIA